MKKNIHAGSDLDGFLKKDGSLSEVEARALKRAAAMDRAMRFILARSTAMSYEFAWARGEKELPRRFERPAEWCRKAILRFCETALSPIYALDPSKPENRTLARLNQLNGMLMSEIGSITAAEAWATNEMQEVSPELSAQLEQMVAAATKTVPPAIARHEIEMAKLVSRLSPATTSEIQENLANISKGASALLDSEGEFVEGKTMAANLYRLIWYFWPHFKTVSSAKELRAGIAEFSEISFSLKTVEAVYTELGFAASKPRKRAK